MTITNANVYAAAALHGVRAFHRLDREVGSPITAERLGVIESEV